MTTLAVCFLVAAWLAFTHHICKDDDVRRFTVGTYATAAGVLLCLILLHALGVLP